MNTNQLIVIVGLGALVSLAGCERDSNSRVTPTPTNTSRTDSNTNRSDPNANRVDPNANRTDPSANRTDTTRRDADADNTAQNERDRTGNTPTPMDQSESNNEIQITAAIRRAVMDDNNLSMNAKNCKIITDKAGVVTLRGPVASQAEKDAIGAKATAVAGVTRVDNLLEIEKAN